jgi:uncharacterized protein (DUF2249 family)
MHLLSDDPIMTIASTSATIDVREVAPRERHPAILGAFRALGFGDVLEIVNDHDPKPLYDQLQAEAAGNFSWDSLQSGPEVWRVRSQKLARCHSAGECCGGCGGGA